MAPLTAKQRNALPAAAFVYPRARKYPVPTKAQARKAGIPEAQRLRMHRNALSRASQRNTSGSYATVARKVRARAGGKVAAVTGPGGTSPPKRRRRSRSSSTRRRRATVKRGR
jgi:hypothetical protein